MTNTCNHDTVIVHYRFIDMLRDYWRMVWGKDGLTPDDCGGYYCTHCWERVDR